MRDSPVELIKKMKGNTVAKAICELLSSLLSSSPLPPKTESKPAKAVKRNWELPAPELQLSSVPDTKQRCWATLQLLNWDGKEVDTSPK